MGEVNACPCTQASRSVWSTVTSNYSMLVVVNSSFTGWMDGFRIAAPSSRSPVEAASKRLGHHARR